MPSSIDNIHYGKTMNYRIEIHFIWFDFRKFSIKCSRFRQRWIELDSSIIQFIPINENENRALRHILDAIIQILSKWNIRIFPQVNHKFVFRADSMLYLKKNFKTSDFVKKIFLMSEKLIKFLMKKRQTYIIAVSLLLNMVFWCFDFNFIDSLIFLMIRQMKSCSTNIVSFKWQLPIKIPRKLLKSAFIPFLFCSGLHGYWKFFCLRFHWYFARLWNI